MCNGYFERVNQATPTRFWINNVSMTEAERAIAAGATGCTQNPAYVWKMINHPDEKENTRRLIEGFIKETPDDDEVIVRTQRTLVAQVAEKFLPMYEASGGQQGFVSVQGNPFDEAYDTIVRQGLYNRAGGVNIMVKVPVVVDGLKAIDTLLGEGAPINATEVFAVRQAMDVAKIYKNYADRNRNAPVLYYSHITGIYDEYMAKYAAKQNLDISPDTLWQAGMIVAKKVYKLTKAFCPAVGFIGGGARGLQHFTEMVGANAAITINWKGTADALIETNPPVVERFFAPVNERALDELLEKMPDFKRGYMMNGIEPEEYEAFGPVELFRSSFTSAWQNAREFVARCRAEQEQK